jgi:hypothetical protein
MDYTKRIFPDVTLIGTNYFVVKGNAANSVDGSSASTPAMAGFISLMNGARRRVGLPLLGFVNPLLYAAFDADPLAFNDIKTGNTRGLRGGSTETCQYGLPAIEGFDYATGLGSPNVGRLMALALRWNSTNGTFSRAGNSTFPVVCPAFGYAAPPASAKSSGTGSSATLEALFIVIIVVGIVLVVAGIIYMASQRLRSQQEEERDVDSDIRHLSTNDLLRGGGGLGHTRNHSSQGGSIVQVHPSDPDADPHAESGAERAEQRRKHSQEMMSTQPRNNKWRVQGSEFDPHYRPSCDDTLAAD